ncbi:proline iminopeptidase [Klenkia soli]|uniref:Proline iminopeptidase n=1 Tax=Klenkia soli TaxID=1052260 RepID=A0A1H0TXN8_9ACTN|nr:prolyl aminopeptidase [Klenkia soli]SDP58693.1 proline iminopeptidase [Klenkia soli]
MAAQYPAIEPHDSGMLDVGDGHRLYWETSGNPHGKPAVVLHGGPGGRSSPGMRRSFDPERYRIVLFDQRNCGRSTPFAGEPEVDLSANTTQHLVADLERLREHLGIDRWLVWGGSWGVTLALVYAETFPERVTELCLVAITSGDQGEIDWITRDVGRVFPREWEAFAGHVGHAADLPAAYDRLLHDPDPRVRADAAAAWCAWEDAHVSLAPDHRPRFTVMAPTDQLAICRVVTHYWARGCFLEPGQVLRDAHRLAGIPGIMVHGRFDVSGPLGTAWALHRAWPAGELVVVGDAGHSSASMGAPFGAFLDRVAGVS